MDQERCPFQSWQGRNCGDELMSWAGQYHSLKPPYHGLPLGGGDLTA